MPKTTATMGPIRKALKTLELHENIRRLESVRRRRGLQERHANLSSELQRLHGQAALLPGLAGYVTQRRAALKAVAKKLADHK